MPNLAPAGSGGSFELGLAARLQYDSVSRVLNGYLQHKRFQVGEGFLSQEVVVQGVRVRGNGSQSLLIAVEFSGSFSGTALFTGRPVYKEGLKRIELEGLQYDIQSKNVLLNTAKWLFDRFITEELVKYATFDLSDHYKKAADAVHSWLNRDWHKGLRSVAKIHNLKVTGLSAEADHLLINSRCSGTFSLELDEKSLGL